MVCLLLLLRSKQRFSKKKLVWTYCKYYSTFLHIFLSSRDPQRKNLILLLTDIDINSSAPAESDGSLGSWCCSPAGRTEYWEYVLSKWDPVHSMQLVLIEMRYLLLTGSAVPRYILHFKVYKILVHGMCLFFIVLSMSTTQQWGSESTYCIK